MPNIRKIIEGLTPYSGQRDPADTRLIGELNIKFADDLPPAHATIAFDPQRPDSVDITTTIVDAVDARRALAITQSLNHRIPDKVISLPSDKGEGSSDLVVVSNKPTRFVEQKGLKKTLEFSAFHGLLGAHLSSAIRETPGVRPDQSWRDETEAAEILVESVFAGMLKSVK